MIALNGPCPCGSGKKYKRCHGMKGNNQNFSSSDPQDFPELIKKSNTIPIIQLLSVLQLVPKNHGFEGQIEEMMRLTLLEVTPNDQRPFATWETLKRVIEPLAYFDDPPVNAFTENAVYSEGNHIIYPGIYAGITEILNQLFECIVIQQNDLSDEFKKEVNDAAGLLLYLSNALAKDKNHSRFMFDESNDEIFTFPAYEQFIEDTFTIRFDKAHLKKVCKHIGSDYEVISEFLIDPNNSDLENSDPDENPVNIYPLLEDGDEIIVYMPTTIHNALLNFIYRKAKQHKCFLECAELLQKKQFYNTWEALKEMHWWPLKIELPAKDSNLRIREKVFQFDNQKFGYLCFIDTIHDGGNIDHKALSNRNREVVEFLNNIHSEQRFQVLSLFVISEAGIDGFFAWEKPSSNNQTLLFKYTDLQTIAYADGTNALSLWKFAKTYLRTASQMSINAIGGILDAYSIFRSNRGSLMHSDDANPIGGMMMIANGSSDEFYREVQKNRDEHAVRVFTGKVAGFTKVIRPKKYAAVFRDKFVNHEHRIVIEDYKCPIWVTNYQGDKIEDITWAKLVTEAIAFWLHKMKPYLESILRPITLIQLEIEVIIEEKLLKVDEYEIKEIPLEECVIKTEIVPPRIQIHIPFNYMYLVRRPDNEADKLLMFAALNGISKYMSEAGKPIQLSDEKIQDIIANTLSNPHAKMILFSDPSQNVKLDSRNLPHMRYLQDADISFVLDNLVSYLLKSEKIPSKIISKAEKIELSDKIVHALISQIETKIAKFNGDQLIEWLIRLQEKSVQTREFRRILIPARLASFSSFHEEVIELTDKEENLVNTSLAIRTLIEFVSAKLPKGENWPNHDEVDELLALTNQVISWGTFSEAMRFGFADPEMGLLPSGRIGTDKTLERDVFEPYYASRMEADVFQYTEDFEKAYSPYSKETADESKKTEELDNAFKDEFGITLTSLSKFVGILINEGFQSQKACIKIGEQEIIELIQSKFSDVSIEDIKTILNLLTLIEREHLLTAPDGYSSADVFPWHYTRPLSYMRRPLILSEETEKRFYYFGYRHLMMYIENLYFLLFTGKLPEEKSKLMRSWIGGVLDEKGKPYRDSVRDWFKANTDFTVIEYEVKMKPGGHFDVKDEDKGDIDVLVIDNKNKIIYSIECKNIIGARNIHEMKSEMDKYLGRDGQTKKSKMAKHVSRDEWLKSNIQGFKKFGIENPDEYQIKSFIMTAEEIPLVYLRQDSLPLPIKSFVRLRKDGVQILENI